MRTTGVDLSAEPANTAVAEIDWSGTDAQVAVLRVGADDATILSAIKSSEKAGIDCPFGWPVPFTAFLAAHELAHVEMPEGLAPIEWRRTLAYRQTDLVTRLVLGRSPLSVSADRIGHTAMRCAGLLSQLAASGLPVDRVGTGAVVEVYPAASLKRWGLADARYKRSQNLARLDALVSTLQDAAPWLWFDAEADAACRTSDDAFDAVIAALTARASYLGRTEPPPPSSLASARTEGWIALPTATLDALVDPQA